MMALETRVGATGRIQNECKKVVYMWCNAHCLNQVMNRVMRCCTEIRNTFGLLEDLHTFMNGHRRHDVFQRSQNEFRHRVHAGTVQSLL